MLKLRKNKKGFTLVELIVVVAIMAVLAGTVAGVVVSTQNKTKNSQANSSAQNLAKAVAELLNTDAQSTTHTYLTDSGSAYIWSGSAYDTLYSDLKESYGDVFNKQNSEITEASKKAGSNTYDLYIATDKVEVVIAYKELGTNGATKKFTVSYNDKSTTYTVAS